MDVRRRTQKFSKVMQSKGRSQGTRRSAQASSLFDSFTDGQPKQTLHDQAEAKGQQAWSVRDDGEVVMDINSAPVIEQLAERDSNVFLRPVLSPTLIANWDADQVWTIPLGGGVGRIFNWGPQPINARIGAEYQRLVFEGDIAHPNVWYQLTQAVDLSQGRPTIILGTGQEQHNLRTALWIKQKYPNAKVFARTNDFSQFALTVGNEHGINNISMTQLVEENVPLNWLA